MKYKRFLGYGAIGLTLIAIGVAFIKPFSTSNLLIRARATNVIGGSIVFDKASATKSGTTNTTAGTTKTGGTVICKTFNNDSTKSSGYVGAVKTGSTIKFFELDGVTEYTFENLYYVSFNHGGTSFGFNLTGIYDDGSPFEFSYSARTTNPRNINFTDYGKVAHLRVEVTSDIVTLLNSITFTYSCSSKHLSGVEVSQAPAKTLYSTGDYFDPSGMLVKAVYSNDTKVATEAYTFSPSGPLSPSDTTITIYYGGFSTTQNITVEDVEIDFSGTFNYESGGSVYSSLTLNSNGTGSYYRYPATYSLTWSYDSVNGLTLTKTGVSGDEPSRGQIFYDSDAIVIPNARLTITSGSLTSLRIYVKGVSVALQTFNKAP
jgi:hypothetical protein